MEQVQAAERPLVLEAAKVAPEVVEMVPAAVETVLAREAGTDSRENRRFSRRKDIKDTVLVFRGGTFFIGYPVCEPPGPF